ncbi:flagellar biosynthesis protein FlhF [Dendrosporobacter sp. 1207_IL3150]|uniref:flagellar biosynthesis protein FlhF n=1 Tax=Dendrosporobacter sp. 1207_IL3150 TaxID=3084054 RepID=UPI002FD939F0
MKVKVFTTSSMQDAMNQVKNELGRDAVILHTRRFKKGGLFGFFGKEMVEVMAAVDSPPIAAALTTEKKQTVAAKNIDHNLWEEPDHNSLVMQHELANMRKMLEQVLHKIPQSKCKNSHLLDLLVRNDVEVKIAENLLKGIPDIEEVGDDSNSVARRMLLDRLTSYLHRIEGIEVSSSGCKTVAFIGPTGVGKTTTIAKLAAQFSIKEGYKVAMITADTYRISAVEQLKTYSDIIGVPIEIVYTPDELKDALYRHQDKNLILIDTAGRSPRNHYQIAELQAFLEVDASIEKHLVLSTSTKYKDALDIVRKFSVCAPQKIIFTKVDEASNIGTIINLLYQFPTTLSYITTGQNVPDDIELSNPQKIANMVLRD